MFNTATVTLLLVVFAANLIPDSASFQKPAVPTIAPPTRPEDDILFQWRLRRKMEQARDWSQSTKTSGVYDSAISRQIPSFVPASASGEPDKVGHKST